MPNWEYYDRDNGRRDEEDSGLFESLEGSDRDRRSSRREYTAPARPYGERPTSRGDYRSREQVRPSYEDFGVGGNVGMYEPKSFSDVQTIIERLAGKEAVIVNLESVEIESAQRILDFLSGASYALGGSMRRIKAYTFLITPQGMGITDNNDSSSR